MPFQSAGTGVQTLEMQRSSGRLLTLAVMVIALMSSIASASASAQSVSEAGPRPPCGGAEPVPAYSAPGAAPNVRTWSKEAARWRPPSCVPWPAGNYRLIVALAGSFLYDGDAAGLLARFGAVSKMRGLIYWSVTDKEWRPLITDASSVSRADGRERRSDFTSAEMRVGADLYYEERDSRSDEPVIYRMRVLESMPDRLALVTENVTPIKSFFLTLFPPSTLRAVYFLQRREPGTWTIYGISSTAEKASALATLSQGSHVNRAAALYRFFLGVPGDREAPLAP
jgi:hypothetical protein